MSRIGIILLAAGASRRMGSPKQLIEIEGVSLVRQACETLLTLRPDVLCVVLGAEADRVRETLLGLEIDLVENLRWAEGMGTTIARGAEHLKARALDGILIALCDQPAIAVNHYQALLSRFESDLPDIVATRYGDTAGVPAVFSSAMFDELAALEGDRGAKLLLADPLRRVLRLPCEAAGVDLDTPSDVERYRLIR